MESIVEDANIYLENNFLTKEEADKLLKLLNRKDRFKKHVLYFNKEGTIKEIPSWRASYWFGDYAQAVQECESSIPTDFALPYKFPEFLVKIKEKIENKYSVSFNSCLVGLFNSPKDKIGFHSDASWGMGRDPHIASLSLGRRRKFKLKHMRNRKITNIYLEHGSLLVMKEGGNTNYKHMVPPDEGCNEENIRINLTFRLYRYHKKEKEIKAKEF